MAAPADDPEVLWLAALVTAALTVAVFWCPGVLLARAWGWRADPLGLVAVGAPVTVGVCAVAAVLLEGRVRWGPAAAAATCALAAVAGLLVRRAARRGSPPPAPARVGPPTSAVAAAVAAGTLLQLGPVAWAMRRPDAYLAAHDLSFHLAALVHVRTTGRGSSLTLLSASGRPASQPTFYAAGWHDVAALVPRWPDPSVVADVVVLLPTALAWSIGLAFLTRAAFPARPRAAVWAPLLGSAGVAPPLLIAMRPEGMVPNAFGLALLPTALATLLLVLRRPSGPAIAVTLAVCTGVATSHPNVAATTALAAAPAVVAAVARALRTPRSRLPAVVTLALVVLAGVTLLLTRTDELSAVTSFPPETPWPIEVALVQLASGNATGMGWATGLVVMGLAAVGAHLARRTPARLLALGCAVLCALFLASTSAVPGLTDVDGLWYGEPRRFTPAIGTLAVPLAAFAVDVLLRRARRSPRPARTAVLAGGCALGVAVVFTAVGLAELARLTFVGTSVQPPLADAAELDMAGRLARTLDRDRAVLGSPFAGTTNLHERTGQRITPPSSILTDDPALLALVARLDDLTVDPAVCAAVERRGIGYLYVDDAPWNVLEGVPDVRSAPPAGVRLVDEGGSAAVYEITGC